MIFNEIFNDILHSYFCWNELQKYSLQLRTNDQIYTGVSVLLLSVFASHASRFFCWLPFPERQTERKWGMESLLGCIWLHQSNKRAHCCSVCSTLKCSMLMNLSLDIETSSRYFHTTWEKPFMVANTRRFLVDITFATQCTPSISYNRHFPQKELKNCDIEGA